jgi:exosortase family protein XrtF
MPFNKPIIKFLLIMGGSTAIWFLAYEFWLKPAGKLDHYITLHVSDMICLLLNITGYDTYYKTTLKLGETLIYFSPAIKPVVRMGASCNGLELFVLFIFFVAAYPGKWKYKIPYLIAGIIIIHFINVLRSYWLTLMAYHHSPYFDLFHRYIFIFMIYGAVFVLWMLWANYYSKKGHE